MIAKERNHKDNEDQQTYNEDTSFQDRQCYEGGWQLWSPKKSSMKTMKINKDIMNPHASNACDVTKVDDSCEFQRIFFNIMKTEKYIMKTHLMIRWLIIIVRSSIFPRQTMWLT